MVDETQAGHDIDETERKVVSFSAYCIYVLNKGLISCVESLILVFHLGRMHSYYCSNLVAFNDHLMFCLLHIFILEISFSQGSESAC